MTFDEFCTKMYEQFPQCQIQEEENGEIVIFTNKAVKRCESEVDEVVDLEPEVCKCIDCQQVTKPDKNTRDCNCPHGMEGDHDDACWYAGTGQRITKIGKIIEVPEVDLTPVNDEVYRRLAHIEADIIGIRNRISTYLNDSRIEDRMMTRLNKLECTISALLHGGDCVEWEIASESAALEYYGGED